MIYYNNNNSESPIEMVAFNDILNNTLSHFGFLNEFVHVMLEDTDGSQPPSSPPEFYRFAVFDAFSFTN